MKSVLRCQNKPKSAVFSIIGLLTVLKKRVTACGPFKRPKQAFSRLSISQCFDSQSRKYTDGGKRGDVIRWSVFDLPPRFAPTYFAFDIFLFRFLAQDRTMPGFDNILRRVLDLFPMYLNAYGFVGAVFSCLKYVLSHMLQRFMPGSANLDIFAILKLCFGISLLYVVYRVIRRAINKV